jgi:hypothetical protein
MLKINKNNPLHLDPVVTSFKVLQLIAKQAKMYRLLLLYMFSLFCNAATAQWLGYGLQNWKIVVRFSTGAEIFSLLNSVQT